MYVCIYIYIYIYIYYVKANAPPRHAPGATSQPADARCLAQGSDQTPWQALGKGHKAIVLGT